MKTIALFGGSFDPPHVGHFKIVEALREYKEIQKIIVMPTYLNPFKSKSFALADVRVGLVKDMFNSFRDVEISTYEVDKRRKVSTIETVEYLLKSYNKIYLVIGADNLASLHKWQNYDKLCSMVTILVATRDNIEIESSYEKLLINENISSTKLREDIKNKDLKTMQKRVEKIVEVLDNNKAENIEVFNLEEKNYFVDRAIIASSLGAKHTSALLNHLKDNLKPEETFNQVDESGDWIVVDLGDILIHIMTPEYRTMYDMENFLKELSEGKEGDAL